MIKAAFSPRHAMVVALLVICCGGVSHAAESAFHAALSDEEHAWLAEHPVLHFAADPNYPPVEFVDNQGRYAGMGADYLKLLAGRLGVQFERVPVDTWSEAVAKAYAHEVDLLPAATETVQRRAHLLFTTPHIILPTVLISARSDLEQMPFADMARHLKVVVVHGFSLQEQLASQYPEIQLLDAPDFEIALQMVSFNVGDVMIGDLATISYVIGRMNITNLRVVRRIEPGHHMSMAVRTDWPMLRKLLDKALADITVEEKRTLEDTWIHLTSPPWWHNRTYQLAAITTLGTFLTLILVTVAWNRALASKVRARTLALEEAHRRLMQAAKLESIGRLAAGVAHEVKNPLAIIQMGLEYLAADIPAESEGRTVIADMEEAIDRADTVVKGLLDFSRENRLDRRPCDLNEVLNASLKFVNHELIQHNIQVVERLAPNLPQINADTNKLKQVFINLFMNAIQAMGRDGRLTITSEVGTYRQLADLPPTGKSRFADSDPVIRVELEDTGPGIDPARLDKVFDPFFTTKPVGEGTGLGLSVSRSIVELHDGTIKIRNREGGGACVVVFFKIE